MGEENRSLHTAAAGGDIIAVGALLDQGMDVSGVDAHGLTAIHNAVWNGHLETVRVLIEWGADLNAKRVVSDMGNSWTPLHFAAENDQPDCARLLLEAGAETDPEDQYGQTPLMIAVDETASPEVARLLLAHGASAQRAWAWANVYPDGPGSEIIELLRSAGAGDSKPPALKGRAIVE